MLGNLSLPLKPLLRTSAALLAAGLWPALAQAETPVLQRFRSTTPPRVFPEPFPGGKFALGEDEIVVFVGQENMVRMQKTGELEARLAMAFASQQPRFCYMAWEGDTVYEQRRELNFGSWETQLAAIDASVVIAHFGQMEALDGEARLPEFIAAYHRLLDRFATKTRRVVLIPPIPAERGFFGMRTMEQKARARLYAEAIRQIAEQRSAVYVDLFDDLMAIQRKKYRAYAGTDGFHLKPYGTRTVAFFVSRDLCRGLGTLPEFKPNPDRFPTFPALLQSIAEKNRLWFNCWRPMNWAFAYGDRTTQLFGQPFADAADGPGLAQELAQYKALIDQEEARIFALAKGEQAPARTILPPNPAPDPKENPAEALAAMTVADGYEVNLFAGEAHGVVNPIQFAWDERGRLFVACSPTYPHIIPGAKPADYILICHDSDGDGTADIFKRFAQDLFMVQGVEPGGGGLYVCAGTDLLHLRDTDGDDRADEEEVVLSGFGTGDAHQLINSICHGPAGHLWFTQGLHIHSSVETPHGIARLEKSGVWRWNPLTFKLQSFFNGAKAGHNCWGVAFDDANQPFHKSGDRPHGYWLLPGMMPLHDPAEYHPTGALFQARVKTNALDFIGTRHLPPEIQGCAILGGFMGHTVDLYRVLDDGAGFKSQRLPELVRSRDPAFRPVDVGVGPDGALYLCDFHNRLIGHYQHSYRHPGRDHSHGRVWRITAKDRPLVVQPDLASMEVADLLEQVKSPERWTRYQAKRLLFDLRKDFKANRKIWTLANRMIISLDPSDPGFTRSQIQLASVLESVQSTSSSTVETLTSSPSPSVRAVAARTAQYRYEPPLPILLRLAKDPHPRVRLEALVAAVQRPDEALPVFVEVASQPRDRFLHYALTNAARLLRPQWQPLAAAGELDPEILGTLQKAAGPGQAQKSAGQAIYESLCLNCHQADGKGLSGVYPPIAKSDWVAGDPDILTEILIRGARGPTKVNGESFDNIMPPSGLADQQIAQLLTYIRAHFGNRAAPVTAESVADVRETIAEDAGLWSAEAN